MQERDTSVDRVVEALERHDATTEGAPEGSERAHTDDARRREDAVRSERRRQED